MIILGIQVKYPSTRELVLLAGVIIVIAIVGAVGNHFGLIPEDAVAPTTSALAAGAILAAFGISIAKDGWRAAVLIVGAATLVWLLLTSLDLN